MSTSDMGVPLAEFDPKVARILCGSWGASGTWRNIMETVAPESFVPQAIPEAVDWVLVPERPVTLVTIS